MCVHRCKPHYFPCMPKLHTHHGLSGVYVMELPYKASLNFHIFGSFFSRWCGNFINWPSDNSAISGVQLVARWPHAHYLVHFASARSAAAPCSFMELPFFGRWRLAKRHLVFLFLSVMGFLGSTSLFFGDHVLVPPLAVRLVCVNIGDG